MVLCYVTLLSFVCNDPAVVNLRLGFATGSLSVSFKNPSKARRVARIMVLAAKSCFPVNRDLLPK